jgi:hypothetical protein
MARVDGIITRATPIPTHPATILCRKNIATPPIKHTSAKMPNSPPLGTNTSAIIKTAHAKYKKIANASHQPIAYPFSL